MCPREQSSHTHQNVALQTVVRVSRSHWYPQASTCSGHAAVLFLVIFIGLSDLRVILKCPRSRNEAVTTEPGRGEGGRGATGSTKLKIHKTEESENVPKKVKIDQNVF